MELKRTLGLWDVFALAAGVMISSGLFVLPGVAYAQAGPGVVFSYALAGLLAIPAMLSQAELATAMPKAGGTYFFVERSLGALPGLIAGLANWFAIAMKSAFALIGIGAFTELLCGCEVSPWVIKLLTIVLCLLFCLINTVSVKAVKKFQSIIVMAVSLTLVGCCIYEFATLAIIPGRFEQFVPADGGWWAILSTAGMVFISYGGLTKIASVGEEVRDPSRNIPLGMILALLVVSCLYVAVVFCVVGVTESSVLAGSLTPLTDAGRATAGQAGMVIMTICAIAALISAANGGIMAASRNPMAMSRDGLLPSFLSKISPRFSTPTAGVLLTAIFMTFALAVLDVTTLVKTASLMMLGLFLMVNLSVLVIRSSGMRNYRPGFRSPFYPWLQILGSLLYIGVIVAMAKEMIDHGGKKVAPLELLGVFVAVAMIWYLLYIRRKVSRESAFMRMVKNVMDDHMERGTLDEELKQIALQRDEVVHDEFDHIAQGSAVVDIDSCCDMDSLFHRAAKILSERLGDDEDVILAKLADRERESSTVIQQGLAIPHFICDGEDKFDMLLVRCHAGVVFQRQEKPVHAVFVLAGSQDRRNTHLRALMAIAHTVQEPDFMDRWLEAVDAEHLRDILLLSGRERQH